MAYRKVIEVVPEFKHLLVSTIRNRTRRGHRKLIYGQRSRNGSIGATGEEETCEFSEEQSEEETQDQDYTKESGE